MDLRVRRLGTVDYLTAWQAMRAFTENRRPETADEAWLLQHPPIFTLGLGGNAAHILKESAIPVIRSDRGGQVTYHAPGQLIVYLMADLRRLGLGVKTLVSLMEQSLIDLLRHYGVAAARRPGAPGVYVGADKIGALGLRVRAGCCYHGIALNVAMDLEPFSCINPCGYPGLGVTQCTEHGIADDIDIIGDRLINAMKSNLGYDAIIENGH